MEALGARKEHRLIKRTGKVVIQAKFGGGPPRRRRSRVRQETRLHQQKERVGLAILVENGKSSEISLQRGAMDADERGRHS